MIVEDTQQYELIKSSTVNQFRYLNSEDTRLYFLPQTKLFGKPSGSENHFIDCLIEVHQSLFL